MPLCFFRSLVPLALCNVLAHARVIKAPGVSPTVYRELTSGSHVNTEGVECHMQPATVEAQKHVDVTDIIATVQVRIQ